MMKLRLAYGTCALLIAACAGCEKPPVERPDIHGLTPFHEAARAGDLETIRIQLENGVTPDLRDNDGVTALHRAARDDKLTLAKLLLDYGADANVKTNTHWSALHIAVQYDHPEMAELLLRYNANPDAQTPQGRTPLHIAAILKSDKCAAVLLRTYQVWETRTYELEDGTTESETVITGERTADLKIKDDEDYTAFQRAINREAWEVVSLLIDAGADCEARDPEGRYADHLIVANAPEHIAAKALKKDTNFYRTDKEGRTIAQIAYERNSNYLIQVIANLLKS